MTAASLETHATDHRRAGMAMVFLAGVLWSTMGLGIRLIEAAGVWQILLYRSLSLALFLFAVLLIRNRRNPLRSIRAVGRTGAVGALALVAAYSGAIYAIQTISVANAMLLFATAPFIAAVLGRIVLHEPVRRATWIAIALALAGIAIMVADKSAGGVLRGNAAAFGSAFGFAVFTVALRRGKAGDMLPAVFLSGLFAIAITTAVCLATGLSLVLLPRDAGIALGMGVFQVGAGLVLYTLGSRIVPAAELTLLSMAEVVLSPVWVWLALGETATANTLTGGAVLLAAIAFNALTGARRKMPVAMP